MKIEYKKINFDSELELNYYKNLVETRTPFHYQTDFLVPIYVHIGRRRTYKPDFVVYDDMQRIITIIETKGWCKWNGREDNSILDFMNNKVATDKPFLIEWLKSNGMYKEGYDIKYRRIKYLKLYGYVDYEFKNPNTLSNRRKFKIQELMAELKISNERIKELERYINYANKEKLTLKQKEWLANFKAKENI